MIEDWWWSDLMMGNLWGILNFTPQVSWTVNRKGYPDYERLIADLGGMGFKNIGYFNPYISINSSKPFTVDANWKQAAAAGYFTKGTDGNAYRIPFFVWKMSQLDLTNPGAVRWFRDQFFRFSAGKVGLDGWLHDFGEYTPYDSIAHDGRTGAELHNLYPLQWAQQARDFWERERPDGDYIFFTRSGFTGLQSYAPLFFTGDRNATDEPLTGLGGQIPAMVGTGITGHPIGTMDIGAFYCEKTPPMGKELFMRWVELGALTPVMRLHRGLYPLCNHWDFRRDGETLAHFKEYSILHGSLFPYYYTLAHEAKQTGWPILRHPYLHFPDDPQVAAYPYQFLIGDRLLAAPVIRLGRTSQQVYLPRGSWSHWWTGTSYEGPAVVSVQAPIGEVPLFIRDGKIVPLFDVPFDTLVPSRDPNLLGWQNANSSIHVLFTGSGRDRLRLWDGTLLICSRSSPAPGHCEVEGGPRRHYSFAFR
jgi:alpha-D-xyloside xylohydrolase/alpha-glucosidase